MNVYRIVCYRVILSFTVACLAAPLPGIRHCGHMLCHQCSKEILTRSFQEGVVTINIESINIMFNTMETFLCVDSGCALSVQG